MLPIAPGGFWHNALLVLVVRYHHVRSEVDIYVVAS